VLVATRGPSKSESGAHVPVAALKNEIEVKTHMGNSKLDIKTYLNKELYGMELVILVIMVIIVSPAAIVFFI
jgi:hypothetical protein